MANFKDIQNKLTELLDGKERFAISYHPDADGMTATAIFIKYLLNKGISRDKMDLYPVNSIYRHFDLEHLQEILSKEYDAIICIDYSVTRFEQLFYLSKRFDPIIYIDHHRYQPELEEIPHLYINSIQFPQLTQPQLFTASKLMNALLYEPSNDWLELVGLDGDVAIQSIFGSPIYKASRILNMLGLVKQKTKDLKAMTGLRNSLIDILLESKDVFDFLENIEMNPHLTELYNQIVKDIEVNLDRLKKMREEVFFNNNKIYVHEIISPDNFEISEHILKEHIKHLKYNETYIIYSAHGQSLTFRIYSSNMKVDCERIARQLFGGGHRNRAGVTEMVLSYLTPEMAIDFVIDKIKDMVAENE